MLRIAVAVAGMVVASGCNRILGIDDLSLRDGGGEVVDTGGGNGNCFGHFIEACLPAAPSGSLTIATDIDTDADQRCVTIHQTAGAPDACAIAATSIVITADIDVTGGRPLILISTTTITVDKRLDAGSHAGSTTGAGGNFAGCPQTTSGTVSTMIDHGGGGGAGGSLGTMGGAGGAGDKGMPQPMAQAPTPSTILRGGCPGAPGGANSAVGGLGGGGGAGGGAVYLIASTAITIDDELRATGGGGRGGTPSNAGGGGGGSGGMLVLEAPTISVSSNGEVTANGGGGGEASKSSTGDDGADDKHWNAAATGGTGHSEAGDGGPGAFGATMAGPGAMAGGGGGGGAGGGGGGGGAGIVRYRGTLGGNVSPPPNTF